MKTSTISKLVVWVILFIILLNVGFSMITMPNTIGNVIGFLIPIVNIIAFVAFLVFYIIHAVWDPKDCDGETHVFSLNGNNWVTKSLLAIKEILNKKI